MAHITRCISDDGCVVVLATDSTDIVEYARQINNSSKVCTAALGRLLTGASLMGAMLKTEDSSVTLRVNGGGETGSVIAVSDSHGNVRGYMMNSSVELPLNAKGKLDVGGAVGKDGYLNVIKDFGLKEPTIGQAPLVSGEIAEDITSYYALSEQIPTVCALGVLVNPDLSVKSAGGYIIQLLPAASDATIDKLEKSIMEMKSVTTMLSSGMTPEEIIKTALKEFEVEVLYTQDIEYKCNCSKERVSKALISLGKEELTEMAKESGETEISCHFCDKVYKFSSSELKKLI